jgi:hypothetical protein
MSLSVSLPLEFRAASELPADGAAGVTQADVGELAAKVYVRLLRTADVVGKLRVAGWDTRLSECGSSVVCVAAWATWAEADEELRHAGIDPSEVQVEDTDAPHDGEATHAPGSGPGRHKAKGGHGYNCEWN